MVFRLYPELTSELQLKILDQVTIVLATHFNKMHFCEQSYFVHFCKLLPGATSPAHIQKIVAILKILGSYSINGTFF